jgi:metal-responsive CopG/Arc/MetJ family transcriptional regulator
VLFRPFITRLYFPHGKKVRITLDVAQELVRKIDRIRDSIGVDRAALIRIWLHERVQKEKASGIKRQFFQ